MKLAELKEKTSEELQNSIIEFKKELFDLRFQKSMHKLEDASKILKIRKNIAQAKTILKQREGK